MLKMREAGSINGKDSQNQVKSSVCVKKEFEATIKVEANEGVVGLSRKYSEHADSRSTSDILNTIKNEYTQYTGNKTCENDSDDEILALTEKKKQSESENRKKNTISTNKCKVKDAEKRYLPMERRSKRVSASQWDIALDFLKGHGNLVRGYNNSSRARQLSQRLWRELADVLNAEGSGAVKTPKDWAIYFNNFKSKLKKMVSDLNTESTATGGGPPLADSLSEIEQRFLSILGSGFGQGVPNVRVNPFPNMESAQTKHSQGASASEPERRVEVDVHQNLEIEEYHINVNYDIPLGSAQPSTSGINQARSSPLPPPPPRGANTEDTPGNDDVQLPRRTRRTRRYYIDSHIKTAEHIRMKFGIDIDYSLDDIWHNDKLESGIANTPFIITKKCMQSTRMKPRVQASATIINAKVSRPMAPIDETRRILLQVETQRAAADAEHARALHLIAQNLGRLADIAERYFGIHQNTD